MRRFPVFSAVLVAAGLAVAACGGTPTASSLPSIPPINLPSGLPTIPPIPSNLLPSNLPIPSIGVTEDPDLAARFPTAIPNAVLGPVTTGHFMDVVNSFEEPDVTAQFIAAVGAAGLDPNALSYGNQIVTIDETDVVQIQALRTIGADANKFVQIFPQVESILDAGSTPSVAGTATIGGKPVVTLTDEDGNVDYIYTTGDVAWRLTTGDEEQAALLMSVLH